MQLNFPNESRCFDASRNSVRFWGYDGALEITFFIEATALEKLVPGAAPSEFGLLNAFDEARDKIHVVADRTYSWSPRGTLGVTIKRDNV